MVMTQSHLVATAPMPASHRTGTDSRKKRPADERTMGLRRKAVRVKGMLGDAGEEKKRGSETETVAFLLLGMVGREAPGDDQQMSNTLEVRRAFLRHCFTNRLLAYDRGHRLYRQLDTWLNLMSIAAGIAASLLVASTAAKGWTIALAVGIAGCQTLSQWLKPAERAAHRGQAASSLRREAWDILEGRERYRGKDINHAWDLFCDRVDMIEGREQTSEHGEAGSIANVALGDVLARTDRRR
jgi:hypothetical protein